MVIKMYYVQKYHIFLIFRYSYVHKHIRIYFIRITFVGQVIYF